MAINLNILKLVRPKILITLIKYLLIIEFIICLKLIKNRIRIYEISELNDYYSQSLKLLIPSKQCKPLSPRTLYFESNFRDNNRSENIEIEIINLDKYDKKYFVTYNYIKAFTNNNIYANILDLHGLIKTYQQYQKHNLFITPFTKKIYIRERKKMMGKYQKKYSFLTSKMFHNKDDLYMNYKYMKNLFNDDYNYMPETYIYPLDNLLIKNKFKTYEFNISDIWLVKKNDASEGSGIFILKSLNEIKYQNYIITKFVQNLHLVNNKKYDLRLYVLITGLKPLRIYFYKEGLVRIASDDYNMNNYSIGNKYMFLTNTAINKNNRRYGNPKNDTDNTANIWNLKTYENELKQKNIDYNSIRQKIKDIIIKSIISVQEELLTENEKIGLYDRNVFCILGFDILINDKYEPVLLEINNRPNLSVRNQVDTKVKANLFVDTLNIVGLQLFSHEGEYKSFDKEYKYNNESDELVDKAFCELSRPRGDYELIFPLKENIQQYKKYFVNNSKENIKFWKIIGSNK